MIKKLKVRNFKSLKDIEIELSKFNVLIGPNNSGKSNLLDCLLFLSQTVASDLSRVINDRGGFKHIAFGGEGGSFEISIEFLLNRETSNYSLSISRRQEVEREKLIISNKTVITRSLGAGGKALRTGGTLTEYSPGSNVTTV